MAHLLAIGLFASESDVRVALKRCVLVGGVKWENPRLQLSDEEIIRCISKTFGRWVCFDTEWSR